MSISWAAFGGSPHDEHSLGSALPLETRQASMISTKWTALGHCNKMPTLWTSTGKLWQVTRKHHEHQLGIVWT